MLAVKYYHILRGKRGIVSCSKDIQKLYSGGCASAGVKNTTASRQAGLSCRVTGTRTRESLTYRAIMRIV
jgi:hypothetical protein